MINNHRIDAMECFFLREDWKHETVDFKFEEVNLDQLRRSISATASNIK